VALLETVSVVDALVQRLREQVLDGVIPAGAAVAETDLAAEFGVSRPTAKSAIVTLVNGGLLRRDAHRSAYVPTLTPEDVADIYRVRLPLELEVVRTLATHATVTPAIQAAFHELGALPDDVPTSRFIAADLRAHRTLVEQYGSPRLSRLYESLLDEIHLCMIQSRWALGRERIAHEHANVLEQIRCGDPESATEAMRTHLQGACRALADAIALPTPEPRDSASEIAPTSSPLPNEP
jgi:DNA-binding GntR family transcriptional regulator